MKLQVNPANLTQSQREHIAAFILSYPTATAKLTPDVRELMEPAPTPATVEDDEQTLELLSRDPDVELLEHDQDSTLPELAFGQVDEVAVAFGVPLPQGATAAPNTAVVVQSETARAGNAGTSAPTAVPPPPVVMPGSTGATVAPNTASPAGTVELDATGLPWDARIHSRTKSKTNAGNWTAKRGVDPSTVTKVEGELRQVMAAPSPVVATSPVAGPAIYPATSVEGVINVPLPGTQGTGGGAASVDPTAGRQAFIGLVGRTSAAMNGGKITQGEVTQICAAAGVAALPLLANRLDLVGHIAQQIDALIASRG
jgi:hypothetical protein